MYEKVPQKGLSGIAHYIEKRLNKVKRKKKGVHKKAAEDKSKERRSQDVEFFINLMIERKEQ